MNIFKKTDIKINTINNVSTKDIKINKTALELNKYQTMHKLIENELSKYLNYFRHGDYDNLNAEFTNEDYIRFGLLLEDKNTFNNHNITKYEYKYKTFDSYRNTFHRVLDGFNLSILNNTNSLVQ